MGPENKKSNKKTYAEVVFTKVGGPSFLKIRIRIFPIYIVIVSRQGAIPVPEASMRVRWRANFASITAVLG